MKFSKEIKVGLSIVISVLAFVFGIRFFKDVPLFTGTYALHTLVDDAKGLIPGNPVRLNGVKVGSVSAVEFDQSINRVRIQFRVNNDIRLPQGTQCSLTGIDALTGVRIELELGDTGNPPIEPGSLVPSAAGGQDLASRLAARAPVLADRLDSVLVGLEGTLGDVRVLIHTPEGDLARSMASLREGAATLTALLREERSTIKSILANVDTVASDLSSVTAQYGDSVGVTIQRLNRAVGKMENTMASLESTTAQLDRILARVDDGSGTLGKLINDPDLYNRLDSVVSSVDDLVTDFRTNPRKYLREMKIVDLF